MKLAEKAHRSLADRDGMKLTVTPVEDAASISFGARDDTHGFCPKCSNDPNEERETPPRKRRPFPPWRAAVTTWCFAVGAYTW